LQQWKTISIAKTIFWASFATILSKFAAKICSPNGCSMQFMTAASKPMIIQIRVQLACK
jgi:hypothetical protein